MAAIPSEIDRPILELRLRSAEELKPLFDQLQRAFDAELSETSPDSLEGLRTRWLGRNKESIRRRVLDHWLKLESPHRVYVGQRFRDLLADEGYIAQRLAEQQEKGRSAADEAALARERVDLSLPGVTRPLGSRHLLRQTFAEIERIFLSLGFAVVEGPEIETPYYNFEALNIPEHHPARDTMDTFYLETPRQNVGGPARLLRTHTSPMQIHTMEKQPAPVRIIVPGKVYRRDNPDATHSYMFHQVEGLAVDTDITFCEFKGTVEYFVREFLGPKIKTRLRPSYFPFTEPSVEVDASCFVCGGSGCRLCKSSGWIELFGAGMVDPAVYGFVNYDAKRLSGYAFGLGVDRLSQLKYGIEDVQLFFQNDVRFLRQFP